MELLCAHLVGRLREVSVTQLFPVQAQLIREILACSVASHDQVTLLPGDLCVCSPTGSGKTLAYALPICHMLLGGGGGGGTTTTQRHLLRAVVVVPSRDLALQVGQVFEELLRGTALKALVLTGESLTLAQERRLLWKPWVDAQGCCKYQFKVDILVCTPGRLVDHLCPTTSTTTAAAAGPTPLLLEAVRFLVVDEADVLLSEQYQQWTHHVRKALEEVIEEVIVPQEVAETPLPHSQGPAWGSIYPPSPRTTFPQLPQLGASATPLPCVHPPFMWGVGTTTTTRPTVMKILCSATLPQALPRLAGLVSLASPRFLTFAASLATKKRKAAASEENEENEVQEEGLLPPPSVQQPSRTYFLPASLQERNIRVTESQRPVYLYALLSALLQTTATTAATAATTILAFSKSVTTVHRLARLLQLCGLPSVCEYSSLLPQCSRTALIDRVRKGEVRVVVCSDAVARGMDIDVLAVVNYEPPSRAEAYVHRVGRTARAGKPGFAFTLVTELEHDRFRSLCHAHIRYGEGNTSNNDSNQHQQQQQQQLPLLSTPALKTSALNRAVLANEVFVEAKLKELESVLQKERLGLISPTTPLQCESSSSGGRVDSDTEGEGESENEAGSNVDEGSSDSPSEEDEEQS